MSPFKEPQPRKTPEGGTPIIPKGGTWPPYARLGHEARWENTDPKPLPANETNPYAYPSMAKPDRHGLEIRKAALEAACALYAGQTDFDSFWPNIEVFETYLRDGTKP